MEVLDADCTPWNISPETWYSLLPKGDIPSCRVGHTATILPRKLKVVIIGGATPTALYDEVWILDLENLECKHVPATGELGERYEHCAFTSGSLNSAVWVFAGANMEKNKNDLWELSVEEMTWKLLPQEGRIPSPRTHHASITDDILTVFGGGSKGSEPVLDQQVYRLDLSTKVWSVIKTKGRPPRPRHGHVLLSVEGQLFCHGGMAGSDLLDDLHVLEPDGCWIDRTEPLTRPCPRAAHGAVYCQGFLYLFGGLGLEGALSDLWKLDTSSFIWEQVEVDGFKPAARLDFAITLVNLPRHFVESEEPDQEDHNIPCILLHGGMNDCGDLFDDFHLLRLH